MPVCEGYDIGGSSGAIADHHRNRGLFWQVVHEGGEDAVLSFDQHTDHGNVLLLAQVPLQVVSQVDLGTRVPRSPVVGQKKVRVMSIQFALPRFSAVVANLFLQHETINVRAIKNRKLTSDPRMGAASKQQFWNLNQLYSFNVFSRRILVENVPDYYSG